MKAKNSRTRGVVLVTVLFLSILISMFIGAAILVGPRTLGLAGSQDGELTAAAAAESGMQYAIMRIRENPEWRGDGSGTVIKTDDFVVVEDSGYVWGHMTTPTGSTSMFRIRFNFENGPGGGDFLNDSSGSRIETPFLSINNLSSASETVVPRAGSGAGSSVADSSVGEYTVPAAGICLAVEGLTGPGVREFDPADPEPKGVVHSKVIEAMFVVSNPDDIATDAAAMAAGELNATVEKGKSMKVESKGGKNPKIRSRSNINVLDADGDAAKYESEGTVYTVDKTLNANYDDGKVLVEQEKTDDPFYKLAWDDVKKADDTGPQLPAGTYVWWDDGTLHYYDMDYDAFETHIKTNKTDPGDVVFTGGTWTGGSKNITLPSSLQVKDGEFLITGNLFVKETTAGTSDLAVIPREGAPLDPPGASGGGDPVTTSPEFATYLANEYNSGNKAPLETLLAATIPYADDPSGPKYYTALGSSDPDYNDLVWAGTGGSFTVSYDNSGPTSWPSLEAALTELFVYLPSQNPAYQTVVDAEMAAVDAGPEGDLDLGSGDEGTAEDLTVEFKPPNNESAVLSANGSIRIGAKLKGENASMTSGGKITVAGAGANFSSTANSSEGVNMYAKDDITLSTLKEKNDGSTEYKDIKLKGLVYTWGDFEARVGSDDPDTPWGKIDIEGTVVAYGADLSDATAKPGSNGKGAINITAEEVKLKFNPAYLLSVMQTLPENVQFRRASWTSYR